MNRQELIEQIKKKKSFLCIGLDSDINKIPKHLLSCTDPLFEFNKQIIDATHEYCVSYKPNTAFYESLGSKGWVSLEKTIEYLNLKYPNHFTIADAKRGDIGNTCDMYAKAFFDEMKFDSITLAPYMGKDSVASFLKYSNKWSIILGLTSNPSAEDFETIELVKNEKLYEKVIKISSKWGSEDNMMYVIGATRPDTFLTIRKLIPDHFLLVPGVGAQGGSLEEVCKYGMNKDCGLLVNSSRGIIYASEGTDFAEKAKGEAGKIQKEMSKLLNQIF